MANLPNSVTAIGRYAFQACNGLASVTFQGTIPSSSFNNSFWVVIRCGQNSRERFRTICL